MSASKVNMENSWTIACPFCFQITAVEAPNQEGTFEIIEDCQNCCHPITLVFTVADGEILSCEATRD
ncbi:MAG: CPXCG motif-containing cysteine-rich protein [Deltaproteobacteria bacterium]|nr:CPXCG motif-containing cysteine-rich protein [Deltaproteobacteria bacterium]